MFYLVKCLFSFSLAFLKKKIMDRLCKCLNHFENSKNFESDGIRYYGNCRNEDSGRKTWVRKNVHLYDRGATKRYWVLASTLIKKWANNTKCLSFITCDWLTAKFQQ